MHLHLGRDGFRFIAINEHALPIMAPLFMPDPDPNPNPNPDTKDAAYWEKEARQAFKDRDTVKTKLRDLEGKVLSDEDRQLFDKLKTDQAKQEEDRARKEGEFDKLRTQLVDKHTGELKDRDEKLTRLSTRFQETVVRAEFGSATDLFGGHAEAKTILDVDLAIAAFSRYVRVEDDEKDPRGYRIVVVAPNGDTILDGKGKPAPFAEAIGELISLLPNKDRILRGSGKSGSGNSGGSSHAGDRGTVDVRQAQRSDSFTDPKAREQMEEQFNRAGGLQIGAAFRGRKR
jgi:hypothetical protein